MKHIIMNMKTALGILVKSKRNEKLNDEEINIVKKITSNKKAGRSGVKLVLLFVIIYSVILLVYDFEEITASALYNIKYYDELSDVYLKYMELDDTQIKSNKDVYESEKTKIYTLLYNNNSAIAAIKSSNRYVFECLKDKQYKEYDSDNIHIKNMTESLIESGYKISESNIKECESDINTIFNSNNYSIYNAVEKYGMYSVIIIFIIINSRAAIFIYIVLFAIIILKLFNNISLYRMKKMIIPAFFITGIIYAFTGYILPEIILSVLLKKQAVIMMGTAIMQIIWQTITGCIGCILLNILYKKYCKILCSFKHLQN